MNNNNIAIKVENIGKCYRIGIKESMHDTFGKSIFNFIKAPLKNYQKYRSLYKFDDVDSNQKNNQAGIIWSLKDISFEVGNGEVVGVIGQNGAGKSTLLKILSKITAPTCGSAMLRGRVSSLLEVGTGFHPELTGRENVYLNGTILGMRKKEIDTKFDEIVDFSGVEKFLDTPVKRYSSGMKVRLAFAVAAYLEPEILIVDEVLAVGDARFQKKCLEKMKDVGKHGRTVLFVSHNMPAVARLCQRTILLEGGRILADGPSHQVLNKYLHSEESSKAERQWPDLTKAPGDEVVRLCSTRAKTNDGRVLHSYEINKPIGIEMVYEVLKPGYELMVYCHLMNEEGVKIFVTIDNNSTWRGQLRKRGRYVSTAWIPENLLAEGLYYVGPRIRSLGPPTRRIKLKDVISFQVVNSAEGESVRGDYDGKIAGVVRPLLKWETQYNSTTNKTGAVKSSEEANR